MSKAKDKPSNKKTDSKVEKGGSKDAKKTKASAAKTKAKAKGDAKPSAKTSKVDPPRVLSADRISPWQQQQQHELQHQMVKERKQPFSFSTRSVLALDAEVDGRMVVGAGGGRYAPLLSSIVAEV
ncbi:hypothetical protein IWW48_002747 [Coemansia sp. RSA 1200]|nr:hypothetical protein IWW48_002747 [Coemansia sp. RSA 1200]